jgi:hypothetical protein
VCSSDLNHKRDVFYMPGCILSMDAPNHGTFVFHPDVCALDAFDSGAAGEGVTDLDLGEELLAFVLMTLGMLIKGYRRERQQIIQVRHDGPAASLLAGLFRGLGHLRLPAFGEHLHPNQSKLPDFISTALHGFCVVPGVGKADRKAVGIGGPNENRIF